MSDVSDRTILAAVAVICFAIGAGVVLAATTPTAIEATDDGVTLQQEGGAAVQLNQSLDANLTNWDANGNLTWETSAGTAVFNSTARTNATIVGIGGPYLNLTSVNATRAPLLTDTPYLPAYYLGGEAERVDLTTPTIDDGVTDLVVNSSGTLNVTYTNLPANTNVVALGDKVYSGVKTNTSGYGTLSIQTSSTDSIQLVTGAHRPQVNNSTMAPTLSDPKITDGYADLTVNVTDKDFPSDTVAVDYYVNGSFVGRETTSLNGAVTHREYIETVGARNFSVDVVDTFGLTNNSTAQPFETISNLTVENESDFGTDVGSGATVDIFYPSSSTSATTDSTGNVSLAGDPAGKQFISVIDQTGYHGRTLWHKSLYNMSTAYLLPHSTAVTNQTIKLVDYSGNYPGTETALLVRRTINGDETRVAGTVFEADNQQEITIAKGDRHCLVVYNTQTGQSQSAGCFSPTEDGSKVIEINPDGPTVIKDRGPLINFRPSAGSLPSVDNTQVSTDIINVTDGLDTYTMTVTKIDSSGSTQVYKTTGNNDDGETLNAALNLTGDTGATINVTVRWSTLSGRSGVESKEYDVRKAYRNQNSLMQSLASVPGRLVNPATFTGGFALLATVFGTAAVGYRFRRLPTEAYGLVGVGLLAGFGFVGWVDLQYALIAGLVFLVISGIRRGL